MNDPMVSTDWLADHLTDPHVKPIDATWFMPGDPRDAKAMFEAAHIPGAVFFDLDAMSDLSSTLPHMLADAATFAIRAGVLGLGRNDTIVVYDGHGLFSAARAWWNFRVMSHNKVYVLDGGIPRWMAEGRPLKTGTPRPKLSPFDAKLDPALVRDIQQVSTLLQSGTEQVVDVRALTRFEGTAPEPRPGVRSGHMPGAKNLPFTELITNGALRPRDDLLAILRNSGIDPGRPLTATCGTGVTASVLALAMARVGHAAAVYDGSWTEWGSRSDTSVVTGPA